MDTDTDVNTQIRMNDTDAGKEHKKYRDTQIRTHDTQTHGTDT